MQDPGFMGGEYTEAEEATDAQDPNDKVLDLFLGNPLNRVSVVARAFMPYTYSDLHCCSRLVAQAALPSIHPSTQFELT